MKNAGLPSPRDNARTKMLRDPSEANKRELALQQRKAKQIINKNKRIWEKPRIETIKIATKIIQNYSLKRQTKLKMDLYQDHQ